MTGKVPMVASGMNSGEEEALVTIDLQSVRFDGEIVGENPWRGVEKFKLQASNTDYEHTEFEGEEIGTVFSNDTTEGRVEVTHAPAGAWRGVVGLHYADDDFSAIGEEAFVPPSKTDALGLFWLEEAGFQDFRLELGMRYEDIDTRTDDGRSADHSPFSISAGAVWHVDEDSHLALNFARAQRAPGDEELFAFGPHIATQVFEIGDPGLGTETSNSFEASYKKHAGRMAFTLTAYHNDFDDFIYLADTGVEMDELPVRLWTQQGASFTGGEFEIAYDIGQFAAGHWQARAFADAVRAKLDDSSYVPRIPPHRFGAGLEWDRANWSAALSWIHAAAQDRAGEYETPTAGYDDIAVDLNYTFAVNDDQAWEIYFKVRNLLNEDIRNHSSFLKDQAPQAGRNFIFGLRVSF
jgi:iron complex outermembrane receptor protein